MLELLLGDKILLKNDSTISWTSGDSSVMHFAISAMLAFTLTKWFVYKEVKTCRAVILTSQQELCTLKRKICH